MTEIGSAYFMLMPSMQGVSAAINKGLADVDTSSAGSSMGDKAGKGFGKGLLGAGAIAGAAAAVTSKAMGAIGNSIGDAVARVDTLNNFPKIMSSLGISSESATGAINKVSDGLTGLPTTLDSATQSVTRFVSKNGDVDKSADMFLAVNNAILAGGAPMEQQSTALEQLTQAYSKGKFDMMEWRSLQSAMPAQLKQVAGAFGMTEEQLYQSLQSGSTSMDDFMGKIMELNESGGEGFASFADQAKGATAGIGTAMANVKTAVTKAIAEVINTIGQERISGVINALGKVISTVGQIIGTVVSSVIDVIAGLAPAFTSVSTEGASLLPLFQGVAQTLQGSVATAMEAIMPLLAELAAAFVELMAAIIPLVAGIIEALTPVFENLITVFQSVMQAILPVATSFIQVATQIIQALTPVISYITSALVPVIQVILSVVSTVINAIMPIIQAALGVISAVIATVVAIINGDWTAAWNSAQSIFSTVWNLIQSIVSGAISVVQSVISGALSIISGLWSSVWDAVSSTVSSIWESVKSTVSSGIDGIISTISSLPGQIMGFFADAGSWLLDAGQSIIQGLADGISGAVGAVTGAIGDVLGQMRDFLPFSPAKKGPFSGKGWTLYSGQAIVEALADGVASQASLAENSVSNVMEGMSKQAEWRPDSTASFSSRTLGSYGASKQSGGMENILNVLMSLPEAIGAEVANRVPKESRIIPDKEWQRAVRGVQ